MIFTINVTFLHEISPILWIFNHRCGYWWPGALGPGHQRPQYWVRTHTFPGVYGLNADMNRCLYGSDIYEAIFCIMMTSCHGNDFRITDPVCGQSISGFPSLMQSCSGTSVFSIKAVKQTIELPVIGDATTSIWGHCNAILSFTKYDNSYRITV